MTLEFWFDFASTYSYLAAMRVDQAAAQAGVPVSWHAFLLGPIFQARGWNDSPFNLYPDKGRYMWRDIERMAGDLGLPFNRPSVFPRNGLLAARILHLATSEPDAAQGASWAADFARAVFAANFADDLDISSPGVLAELLQSLDQEPKVVIARAISPENKAALRALNEEAVRKGIFGAPSFLVGGELFWGNDRLDQAIAWAKRS